MFLLPSVLFFFNLFLLIPSRVTFFVEVHMKSGIEYKIRVILLVTSVKWIEGTILNNRAKLEDIQGKISTKYCYFPFADLIM